MSQNPREIRRLDHLIQVIHADGIKAMKWQWLRTGAAAFVVPFVTILLATDQPITKNLLVSAVIAGLAAAARAVDPQVRLSAVERHLDDAHVSARFDWDPEASGHVQPIGTPFAPPQTPSAPTTEE